MMSNNQAATAADVEYNTHAISSPRPGVTALFEKSTAPRSAVAGLPSDGSRNALCDVLSGFDSWLEPQSPLSERPASARDYWLCLGAQLTVGLSDFCHLAFGPPSKLQMTVRIAPPELAPNPRQLAFPSPLR